MYRTARRRKLLRSREDQEPCFKALKHLDSKTFTVLNFTSRTRQRSKDARES